MSLRHPRWARRKRILKAEIMLGACMILTVLIWALYVFQREIHRAPLPYGLQ